MSRTSLHPIAAVFVATAATIALAPAPANAAEIRCTHSIDTYKNQYEVTFTHNVQCDGPAYGSLSRIESYRPSTKSANNWCSPSRWCRSTVGFVNTPGTQEYCARAWGDYYPAYNDYRYMNARPLPEIRTCTYA
ncbi:hypothetical protein ACIBH1_42310 [Nonomuraea sp. NPDC050663]|uniref:hypothetical protein n=1 Tax=Nonomuraea sp. NPDC050663 TaxID=3364370 RepID=UPI00378EF968